MSLDRRPLDTLAGLTPGRQVKLGPALDDARSRMTYTAPADVLATLKEHGYTGTVDTVLGPSARFPVTIPEGTRGIVEGVASDDAWAIVIFVWKTPKSGKITAAAVQVAEYHLVNHRGAPPLPGMPMPGTSTAPATTEEPPTMFAALTATPQATPPFATSWEGTPKRTSTTEPAPAPSLGAMDALLNAVVDARVGARIAALEAELASRPTGAPAVRVSISGLPEVQLEGTAHALLPEALRWAASRRRNGMRFNVALVGDAGTGKSTLAEQVAQALGLRFHPFSCSGGVAESKLFGRMTPNLSTGEEVYRVSELVDYFANGGVFLLDEMDGLDANVLTAANGMFEAKRWGAPNGQVIERHPDFLLFSAMNTYGTGASRLYTGRSQLDAASLDRWVVLECGYDAELERSLCSVPAVVDAFHAIRDKVRTLGLRRWVTGRMIERAEVAHVCHGVPVADAVRAQLAGWSDADLKACGVAS